MHLFINDARVIIFCYAIDDENSYNQLLNWAELLSDHDEEFFSVLVGNKKDLSESRAVQKQRMSQITKELPNLKINVETSTYDDVQGIQDLFTEISKIIVNDGFYSDA